MRDPLRGRPALPEDRGQAAARRLRAARVDSSVPNAARVWNSLIGGRDNFEADRSAARQLRMLCPEVMAHAGPASRAFLRRAVTYLAAEAGIRQFLDIGTGLPAPGSAHCVAQAVDPDCRVVYVDNDPVVISHARADLRSTAGGVISCLHADARDARAILDGARATLDLNRPAGSYLAVVQPARDKRTLPVARRWNQLGTLPAFLRDRDQVARWLDGLELAEPGIVEVHQWRPAPGEPDYPGGMPLLAAVARKP